MTDRDQSDHRDPERTDRIRIVGAEEAGAVVGRGANGAADPDDTGEIGRYDMETDEDPADPNDDGDEPTAASPPADGGRRREVLGADDAQRPPRRSSIFESIPDASEVPFPFGDDPKLDDAPAPSPEAREPEPSIDEPPGRSEHLDRIPRIDATAAGEPPEEVELPHWTAPATGQVPKVLLDDNNSREWSSYGSTPRWRDQSSDWEAEDFSDVSDLADDESRVGALDSSDRPEPDDFFSFDEFDTRQAPPSFGEREATGGHSRYDLGRPPATEGETDRNVPLAIGVGAGLGVAAIVLFNLGAAATMGLVTLILFFAAVEFYASARRGGLHPATLVGLAACVGLPLAVYWRGVVAYPLVMFLSVVFGLLWYLAGVEKERPAANLGVTMLGIGYVGILGSFAAMILRTPMGTDVLLAAIVPTVAYDVVGYVVGRNAGKSPLSAVSPNKTVEGLLGGCFGAMAASVAVNNILFEIEPFDQFADALLLGAAVAVVAPLGDLAESLIKRDFGVKDMGTLLPGHGGFLDRFDALLFVLPTTYYLGVLLELIPVG
ncbi:MAG: phosphatidate cytidylyltransferase [Actinomycetota bacterium]|nr:phosphatidate cytidylyltransferase [Actinomycetota bacterium]